MEGEYVKFYHTTEIKRIVTTYVNGVREGPQTGYFTDGEKKSWMANWKGETPVGTHLEWHETREGAARADPVQEAGLALFMYFYFFLKSATRGTGLLSRSILRSALLIISSSCDEIIKVLFFSNNTLISL